MALLINFYRSFIGAVVIATLVACSDEPRPPSVSEYLDNRILHEATMVRCAENRSESKYNAECVNAREAANRIAADEAAARRQELEAQSERKRQALRRTQEAAAEARRRAAEAERLRREAELLGQYPPAAADPAGDGETAGEGTSGPESNEPAPPPETEPPDDDAAPAAADPANAPPGATDLDSVREALRRRQDGADDPQEH